MTDYAQEMFEAAAYFEVAEQPQAVADRLARLLSGLGFHAFLITQVPEPPLRIEPYMLLNNWPGGWSDLYSKKNYYADDPVASWCRKTVEPFEWKDAPYCPERNPKSREIMNIARDFGMLSGFLVPIVRTTGFQACVTMAGSKPDLSPPAKRTIHIVSAFAHARLAALQGRSAVGREKILSKTEREILSWVAAGKSSWEISQILRLSKSSVDTLVNRAARKLDAVNRTQAVVKALRMREIDP